MSKYHYTKEEKQINAVLNSQSKHLQALQAERLDGLESTIHDTEKTLEDLGYSVDAQPSATSTVVLGRFGVWRPKSWDELCKEAVASEGADSTLETLFNDDELLTNTQIVRKYREEYNTIHRLDRVDVAIIACAALLGAAVDILLVGIPKSSPDGIKSGRLSDYIRREFDKKFPKEEMEKLANSTVSKVPYDAQDNRNTKINVEGLSAYYHRLLSLGHDPILGWIFGVADILNGTMTTIDKAGVFHCQRMINYSDRTEKNIFAALAKQLFHIKSDITTSMGLPAPMMALFNFLQFGTIGEYEQTVAEIVQGMYYEGYDFIHFCSMSVPTMLIELITRMGYAIKRIKEGNSIRDSIPFSLNREKHPKLATMLFSAHSAATAINAGKVCFTKNPMAINYPQWIHFVKYSYQQLLWVLFEKPESQERFIKAKLGDEFSSLYADIDAAYQRLFDYQTVIDLS